MDNPEKDEFEGRALEFRYQKSQNYLTHHADGFMAGWGASRNLYVDVYLERAAFPDLVVHKLTDDGLGPEIGRQGGEGLIRDRLCGIVINVSNVIALRDLLSAKLDEAMKLGLIDNDTQ